MNKYMLTTRVIAALWTAGVTVAALFLDPVKVLATAGSISGAASVLANMLTDNTWPDAIANGFAYNVTAKTTTTPVPVVGSKVG